MAAGTRLVGPWDLIKSNKKIAVQASVPLDVKLHLFQDILPRHGSENKVLSRLICVMYGTMRRLTEGRPSSVDDREELANDVLNSIQDHCDQIK